ncbi:MAG: hypothetical protein ACR2GH_17660 [Pseudonocardia sp.]
MAKRKPSSMSGCFALLVAVVFPIATTPDQEDYRADPDASVLDRR